MVWPLCSASSWRSMGSTGHRWMVCEARFTKMNELSGESAMLMMGALSTTVTATCQNICLHQQLPWTCWHVLIFQGCLCGLTAGKPDNGEGLSSLEVIAGSLTMRPAQVCGLPSLS